MIDAVLVAHATWLMTGVIWTVQIVHYPLFAGVGPDRFLDYARAHTARIIRLVAPVMLVELATGAWLALDPPAGIAAWQARGGFAVLGVILAGHGAGATAAARQPAPRLRSGRGARPGALELDSDGSLERAGGPGGGLDRHGAWRPGGSLRPGAVAGAAGRATRTGF